MSVVARVGDRDLTSSGSKLMWRRVVMLRTTCSFGWARLGFVSCVLPCRWTERDVLLLRLVAGLTVEQVAATVGKSVGATKALQRRGLAALQRELERRGVTL